MRFSQEFLADIRERVPLSQIVGRAVSWDRRKSQPGKGDYWACCPFHHEKTPSFHVDDRKGFYHCFGCHQSGDHLRFLTDHDGLAFPDAVKALAESAGVALPEDDAPPDPRIARRREDRAVLEAAAEVFRNALWGPGGRNARTYAAERGLTDDTLRTFDFGFAPDGHGFLTRQLADKGFDAAAMVRAGLAVERDGSVRERFRGRFILPIHDHRGQIVGFGGRTLDGREPKYLNSPETPLFDKSTILFNAHRARGAAHRSGRLFIVEGYLDAVALAEAGIGEVVASLGTALTEAQVKRAWSLADEPIVCFDGDKAGQAAADRAMDRVVPLVAGGRTIQLLHLPKGQDPDDLVRAEGPEGFARLAARAMPLVEALFAREAARGTDTPERIAALEERLAAIAGRIEDERLSRLYQSAFRDQVFALSRRAGKTQRVPPPPRQTLAAPATRDKALLDLERIVLGLMIYKPRFIEEFGERMGENTFVSAAHASFAAALTESFSARLPETPAELLGDLPASQRMCLGEVWGDAQDEPGKRLLERFSILACEPDERFLARCMGLFLDRLDLRAEVAELAREPQRLAATGSGPGTEARLLSLSAAIAAQKSAIQDAERALADDAAALRRQYAAIGTDESDSQD
ncbi:MAG: DNA primase [Pseudomonadota bacterium]